MHGRCVLLSSRLHGHIGRPLDDHAAWFHSQGAKLCRLDGGPRRLDGTHKTPFNVYVRHTRLSTNSKVNQSVSLLDTQNNGRSIKSKEVL